MADRDPFASEQGRDPFATQGGRDPFAAPEEPKIGRSYPRLTPEAQKKGAAQALGFGTSVATGVPGFAGDIESLGRTGAQLAGFEVSPETVLPTTQELTTKVLGPPKDEGEAAAREAGGMVAPVGTVLGSAAKVLSAPSKLDRILQETGELGRKATLTAEEGAKLEANKKLIEEARKRQALRTELGKEERRVPETSQLHDAARFETKLAAPDTEANLANKTDINSQVGKLAEQKFAQAETKQAVEGGSAFENYKQVASELQQEQPFGTSKPGKVLQNKLDEIIKGGSGDLRQYGEGIIKIAKDVRRELFGATASDISPQEIKAVADTLPKSMSEAARNIQARSILESKLTQRKPVDFKVVDEKIRELRGLAANKNIEGFTGVQANRLKNVAKDIEDSLKSWVGEDVYPRAAYAEASEELNKFKEELSKVVSRKRGQYETSTGEIVSGSNAADLIFKDRKSVNLAKSLLGDAEVSSLAEKYAANELNGKTGKQIADWLKNPNNAFIYEVEGLADKLQKYGASVARREQEATALDALRKQQQKAIKESEKIRESTRGTLAEKQDVINKINKALEKPEELPAKFGKLREDMEKIGVFAKEDLDALQTQVDQIGKIVDQRKKREEASQLISALARKIYTLGMR
jgi:hypothetical protein